MAEKLSDLQKAALDLMIEFKKTNDDYITDINQAYDANQAADQNYTVNQAAADQNYTVDQAAANQNYTVNQAAANQAPQVQQVAQVAANAQHAKVAAQHHAVATALQRAAANIHVNEGLADYHVAAAHVVNAMNVVNQIAALNAAEAQGAIVGAVHAVAGNVAPAEARVFAEAVGGTTHQESVAAGQLPRSAAGVSLQSLIKLRDSLR